MLQQLLRARLLDCPVEGGNDSVPLRVQRSANRRRDEGLDSRAPALNGEYVDGLELRLSVGILHEAHCLPVGPASSLRAPPQLETRQR